LKEVYFVARYLDLATEILLSEENDQDVEVIEGVET
jgi:hypothetical protein